MDIFGDLTTDAIAAHQAAIAADALADARRIASAWLATGPGHGLTHDEITDTLTQRNATDPQYQRLAPFEKRWALLVIRLLRNAMDATPAVHDAHHRGASWADIGNALGIARATAFNRFSETARATRNPAEKNQTPSVSPAQASHTALQNTPLQAQIEDNRAHPERRRPRPKRRRLEEWPPLPDDD
ncbi:hypothetical protein KL953_35220 [Mycolicibacterium goodii]|uniref:hypothetical protein n=1 Tax=Mycolicibacterium goodii TaxID=134601 RepID=UPI001BDDBE18|nr:hypothetical protein [Mycolicibacterium goodii]MBU8814113.1 hypothetical protein [Mycolicibacterium goodii]